MALGPGWSTSETAGPLLASALFPRETVRAGGDGTAGCAFVARGGRGEDDLGRTLTQVQNALPQGRRCNESSAAALFDSS